MTETQANDAKIDVSEIGFVSPSGAVPHRIATRLLFDDSDLNRFGYNNRDSGIQFWSEVAMSKRSKQLPPALKHGGYSGMTLLPCEDPAAFEKLYDELIAEYVPSGRHEEDLIENLAHLIWRKQNLLTYRLVEQAKIMHASIYSEANDAARPPPDFSMLTGPSTHSQEEIRALYKAADARAQNEMGSDLELVKLDEIGTTDYLMKELDIHDRLDGMIDRCLKRLLFIRGLKSISSTQTPVSQPRIKKVA